MRQRNGGNPFFRVDGGELRVGRKAGDGKFLYIAVMFHARHTFLFVESDDETDTPFWRKIGIIFQRFHGVKCRETRSFIVVDAARRYLVTFDQELKWITLPSAPGGYDVKVTDCRDHFITFTHLDVPGDVAEVNRFKPHTACHIEKDLQHALRFATERRAIFGCSINAGDGAKSAQVI